MAGFRGGNILISRPSTFLESRSWPNGIMTRENLFIALGIYYFGLMLVRPRAAVSELLFILMDSRLVLELVHAADTMLRPSC